MNFTIFWIICIVIIIGYLLMLFSNTETQNVVLENKDDYIKYENSKQADDYNFGKVKGKFCNITQCRDCKATDEYWSQHPARACPYCGGLVREYGSAIYINGYWYTKKEKGN